MKLNSLPISFAAAVAFGTRIAQPCTLENSEARRRRWGISLRSLARSFHRSVLRLFLMAAPVSAERQPLDTPSIQRGRFHRAAAKSPKPVRALFQFRVLERGEIAGTVSTSTVRRTFVRPYGKSTAATQVEVTKAGHRRSVSSRRQA